MHHRPFIYLATPYSHPDESVRVERFNQVNDFAAFLIGQGKQVISPISMCHPIAVQGNLPGDWEYWRKYAESCLSVCHAIYVLELEGWEESKGVRAEIEIGRSLKLPIAWYKLDRAHYEVNWKEIP